MYQPFKIRNFLLTWIFSSKYELSSWSPRLNQTTTSSRGRLFVKSALRKFTISTVYFPHFQVLGLVFNLECVGTPNLDWNLDFRTNLFWNGNWIKYCLILLWIFIDKGHQPAAQRTAQWITLAEILLSLAERLLWLKAVTYC